jgi:hypothetical protein
LDRHLLFYQGEKSIDKEFWLRRKFRAVSDVTSDNN